MAPLSRSSYPEYAAKISNKKQAPLGWGNRPALVIMDLTSAYFSPSSPVSILESTCGTAKSLPTTVSSLIVSARTGGCPVVWARTLFTNTQFRDAGLWAQKMPTALLAPFQQGRNDFLAEQELRPLQAVGKPEESVKKAVADLVIDKKFASAFFGTNLAMQLAMLGVDTVVICGARTSGEIRQTALDAQGLGFRPIIAADACADSSRETHLANLFDMRAKMGDVVTTEDAIEGLKRGWSWPS